MVEAGAEVFQGVEGMSEHEKKLNRNSTAEFLIFTAQAGASRSAHNDLLISERPV